MSLNQIADFPVGVTPAPLDEPPGRRPRSALTGRFRRRWGGRERDTPDVLRNMLKDLAGVSSSTEGVFLLVGGRLMDLQSKAREIARLTASISELLSNDDSMSALDELLNAEQGGGEGGDTVAVAEEIQKSAKAIHQAIEAIDPVVNTFYALGVMTRIESARSAGAGTTFAGLADSVTALSRQIREQIAVTAASAAALLETAAQAADDVDAAERKHRNNLSLLTAQVASELVTIREHRALVTEAGRRLAERFDRVSTAVGDVVTALQSHDIVRQQIEHVIDALSRQIDGTGPSGSSLSEVVRLQAAQLAHSRTIFENSVRQIREALSQIEQNIGEVAEESARLLGLSDSNATSFLSSVKSDLASILAILDSNRAADRRLAEAAASVDRRVAEISQTMAGVHAIGVHMQHIALNATIQAAGLGQEGAAMRIVAHTIREHAQESEETYNILGSGLERIQIAASALREAIAGRRASEAQGAQLRHSAQALSSTQQRAQGDYSRTAELAAELKSRIRTTVVAFGDQNDCLEILAGATGLLSELCGSIGQSDLADGEQMMSLYTMQSERAVHAAVCYTDARNAGQSTVTALPSAVDDNVEFF